MIHTVKGFSVVDEAEVDVFLEFPSFLYDPANAGNLISGSCSFSKPSLDIWKFLVRIMLNPSMQDFKHDLTSMGDECNCLRVHSLVLPFLGTGMRTDLCQSCAHGWVFQTCWHNECKTLMASAFRDLVNSSAGISSHPPALLTAMLLKAHLTPECPNIRQLHSSPMLVRSCLKFCMLGFSIMWAKNFQISKLGLEKEEELEIKLSTFAGL